MTEKTNVRILVIGYGNPGRLDDGLGPAFAESVQALNLAGVTVEANYQLNVEDADAIAQHDIVLFVDASADGQEPYSLAPLEAQNASLGFSSHTLSPGALLGYANALFSVSPKAYLLAIRGYDYDAFGERLSHGAQANLSAAIAHLEPLLRSGFASA